MSRIKQEKQGVNNSLVFANQDNNTGRITYNGSTFTLSAIQLLPNGTAAAPSLSFSNSVGVGLYRSASNVLGIATAGVARVLVTAAGQITINGGQGIEGGTTSVGTYFTHFTPSAAQQAITGPGAVTVNQYYTAMTATGAADAMTMANGLVVGQLKKVRHVAGANTMVLTPATASGFTTCTFPATFVEFAVFMWTGAAWTCIENAGCTLA